MKRKLTKFIFIIASLLLVASILISFTIAQDRHHIDTCCENDCEYCSIIHIAQELLIRILAIIINVTLTSYCIVNILAKIHAYNYINISKSLVFQKVQLNE
ncbi:MAG: hypothetical protein IKP28_05295 [Clostridia bacterium]|nr:hypothetical protein [Clostridia bacterium]